MAAQPTALIYKDIVAVSPERFGKHSVELGQDFSFAAHLDAVPVLAEEFAALSQFCPVVFAGPAEAPLPHAMLGLKSGKNMFVTPKGGWGAPYIPAFFRRYPFISAQTKGSDGRVLAVDARFSGLNTAGRGQAFYGPDGKPSKFLDDIGRFVANFDRSLAVTRAFVEKLRDLDLLEPMTVTLTDSQGDITSGIGGMFGVSQTRLDGLSADQRAGLQDSGAAELCKLHRTSLNHLRRPGVAKRPAPTALRSG